MLSRDFTEKLEHITAAEPTGAKSIPQMAPVPVRRGGDFLAGPADSSGCHGGCPGRARPAPARAGECRDHAQRVLGAGPVPGDRVLLRGRGRGAAWNRLLRPEAAADL